VIRNKADEGYAIKLTDFLVKVDIELTGAFFHCPHGKPQPVTVP